MERVGIGAVSTAWWHFFWRYAVAFVILNFVGGILINHGGRFFPQQLYVVTIFFGVWANLIASFLLMMYCWGRKFKGSKLILLPYSTVGTFPKIWSWILYFWRFIFLAFLIGFAAGAALPFVVKWLGADPVVALKYSKYLGIVAILPASYFAFLSLAWRRKEKHCKLRVVAEA